MEKCVFCDYDIRDLNSIPREQIMRRDTVSFEFFGKWVCGNCHDTLSEFLESE